MSLLPLTSGIRTRARLSTLRRVAGWLLYLLIGPALLQASPLKSDEEVLLLPQPARLSVANEPLLTIESVVYERERRPGLTTALAHYLDLDVDALSAPDRELLYARTQLFRIDFERGKQLQIRFDAVPGIHRLVRSNAHGRSRTSLRLPALTRPPTDRWLQFQVVTPRGDSRMFRGKAQLLAETGLSVISDIDDTIKHSAVRQRRELLLNTFVRPFQSVPGMASLYRDAAQAGAALHYVSGSPLQLYPALSDFIAEHGFPEGSMHLREVDLSAEVFGQSAGTRGHKLAVIRQLIGDFPRRRWLLVGDSGELDPEIYGELAREFPQAIEGVWIRDVSGDARDSERYRLAFDRVPATWVLFKDPGELPDQYW